MEKAKAESGGAALFVSSPKCRLLDQVREVIRLSAVSRLRSE